MATNQTKPKSRKISPLTYTKAIVNFTYSFSWDISACDFSNIADSANAIQVKSESDIVKDKWLCLYLFNRPISWEPANKQASYHPNIISQNLLVLHRYGVIDNKAEIIIPVNKDGKNNPKEIVEFKKITTQLNYALRIYENGSGNCTFTFILDKDVSFEKIHFILHLASSISYIQKDLKNVKHLTYGWLNGVGKKNIPLYPPKEEVSLTDLFSCLIDSNHFPTIWKRKKLWFDSKVIKGKSKDFNNWQSPFVTTFLQLNRNDFDDFENGQAPEHIKEIGSFACRFSLDNSRIIQDANKLKREYVFNSFGFYHCPADEKNRSGLRMKNYSHHCDLFYTIGKRGAVAISPDFTSNPSYYVLPTFLNLIEILRSRWHIGSIVNLKLDELLESISHTNEMDVLQEKVFRCKVLYGLFLKNPTPYLFDGGAITDIAEVGESIFWLDKLSSEMEKKFYIIDNLVNDIYSRKKYKEFYNK